jgi:hypothetical protein
MRRIRQNRSLLWKLKLKQLEEINSKLGAILLLLTKKWGEEK